MLVEGLRGQRDRLAGKQVRLAGPALGLGRGTVGGDPVDRGAMGTNDVGGFGHGMRPLDGAWPFGPNQRRFKRSNTSVRMSHHEFVIVACGNLAGGWTYWLQEPQAPTVRLLCRLPDPISSLLWRFPDERQNRHHRRHTRLLARRRARHRRQCWPRPCPAGRGQVLRDRHGRQERLRRRRRRNCAGTSTVDYDPGHWKYVAKGTCEGMTTPKGHGSLTAMWFAPPLLPLG